VGIPADRQIGSPGARGGEYTTSKTIRVSDEFHALVRAHKPTTRRWRGRYVNVEFFEEHILPLSKNSI